MTPRELAESKLEHTNGWKDVVNLTEEILTELYYMKKIAEGYEDLLLQCANNLGPYQKLVFTDGEGLILDQPNIGKVPEIVGDLAFRLEILEG